MIFKRNKKNIERLKNSFGELKDETFNFNLIEKYFRNKDNSSAFQVLSDKTCNDLDFQELFMFIDRTNSKIGQQFLYNKLKVIPSNSENTELEEEMINKLKNNTELRVDTQLQLEKLNKDEAFNITTLFQEEHIKPPKWYFIIPLLSFTSFLTLILTFFIPQFFLVLLSVFFINFVIHFWNKKNLNQYLGSIPQLLRLNDVARNLYKVVDFKKLNPTIFESIKIIDKVRNRMMFFKLEAKLQGEFEILFWAVLELFKTLFILEPLLLFGVLKRLNTKRKEIETIFSFVGQIDTLISVASLRQGLDFYCIPDIDEKNKVITANEVYHPLVVNCISNTIKVSEKSILLTGSNMSGKTSFIRTIGLNVITGLTINTCFANSMTIPRIKIFSAIRLSDDLLNDKSYYFEEVLTVKNMIENSISGYKNLFLLDEIFKGTNTIERISAGKAVLSSLTNSENSVFVTTHDIELADMLCEEYELYHFSEIIDNKTVDFDYKLKEGKSKNRNAIRILQINNYPEKLINEALEISKTLDKFYN